MNSYFRKGLLLALALFSSQVLAISPNYCLYCNRFYVGATAGILGMMDRESTDTPTRSVHYLGAAGPMGGAILGFDFCVYDKTRFELEGFANVMSVSASANQSYAPQSTYNVRMRYNLGVRGLPTYDFTPETAGHLILGYSYGKFKIHDNGNYGIVSKMFGQNGIQYGVGIETFMAKWALLRGDVIYTAYPNQVTSGVTTGTPSSTQVYTNKLSTLEADLTLVYKLGQL